MGKSDPAGAPASDAGSERSSAAKLPPDGRLLLAARAVFTPVVLILVMLGPVLGGLAYRIARDGQRESQQDHLEDRLAARAYDLRATTLRIVEALHAVKSFFICSDEVTPDEFARYTGDALLRHPAIHVMAWVPYVPADLRPEHEARMRADGLLGYQIRELDVAGELVPAEDRDAYFPVDYAEPSLGNEGVIGFDLGSETTRDRALRCAADACDATLTDPVQLVQETETARSVLGVLPVFLDGETRGIEALRGFVTVACRIPTLVLASQRASPTGEPAQIEIRLLDDDVGGLPEALYATRGWREDSSQPLRIRDRKFEVAGQTWRLQGVPSEFYLAGRRAYQPLVVGAVAFVLWELLCGFLILLAKRARERVTRKQARFIRSVLQSLTEGVVVADGEGRVQLANDAADRLVGTRAGGGEETEWSSSLSCYLPDAETPYPADEMPLARAIQGRQVIDEDMYVQKAAGESGVWLSVSASPIHDEDEDLAGGVVVFRDITERKRSEAAILRLSEAVEQSADAVFITDRRGRIEYVNAAFEETTGYSREEILGQTPRVLGPDSYTDEQYRELWRTILRGNVHRSSDTTRRKDGSRYHVEQTITPMRSAQGRVTHFVSVARDVTEKRLRREQQFEMDLAAQVQQRLFPQAPPRVPGFDVAGAVFPAAETSGDYYDFIERPGEGLTLAIGDVSGHGFGPALLMAETRAYLRSLLGVHAELDVVLDRLNHSLLVDFRSEHFVTLLLAHIDLELRTLVHANAGHVPGYVLDRDGEVKAELTGTGSILGVFEDREYECGAPIQLASGDLVVLLTDGVTEASASKLEFFGSRRALKVLRAHRTESAREIVDQLYGAVREFSNEAEPTDDTTLIVCKVG